MPEDIAEGVDSFSADAEANGDAPISQSEAIRRILRDWLIGHGYLKAP